jgi:hypothetical protein
VTITKSITIDCHEVFGSILSAGTNGINMAFDSFGSTDVRKTVNIRNLNIQGFDSGIIGIQILGAGAGTFVNIEDCLVNGIFGPTGIGDARTNGDLTVTNTTIRDNGGNGISAGAVSTGNVRTTINNVRIYNSNNGISVGSGAAVFLTHSVAAYNAGVGVIVTGGQLNISSVATVNNGTGLQAQDHPLSVCLTATLSSMERPQYRFHRHHQYFHQQPLQQ